MSNQYGVSEAIWHQLLATCSRFPAVNHVILYGSRARGDYREGSDIDLAIDAPSMSNNEFAILWNALDDLPLVFSLDVVHLQQLENDAFKKAISEEGVVLNAP